MQSTSRQPTLYKDLDAFAGTIPKMTIVESDTAPYASALTTLDDALLRYTYPAQLQTDVRALVNANEMVISDIAEIPAAKIFRTWEMGFVKDDTAGSAAQVVVNNDLGLPAS